MNPIDPHVATDGAVLLCPRCGENYLHHGQVEIFDRREDADGLHTTVGVGRVAVDRDMSRKPSSRRHGIAIGFWCEQCNGNEADVRGASMRLTIAQHKGQTFLAWEAIEP